jgi:hypothetical protein
MDYSDFITTEELRELPDDSNLAFAKFVRIAQTRLSQHIDNYNPGIDREYNRIKEAQYTYAGIVIGAARARSSYSEA